MRTAPLERRALQPRSHVPQTGVALQFPVLRHGSNIVTDSSCIFTYLANTYPDKMKLFLPDDPR